MEQINYEELLPVRPEEDVVAFACQNGAFKNNYLIYKSVLVRDPLEDRMKDAVRVTCSACGEHFYADKIKADGCGRGYAPAPFGWRNWNPGDDIISGQHTLCPLCGAEAETVHVGNMRLYRGELVNEEWVSVLSRLPVKEKRDRLVLIEWCVRQCVNKQAEIRYEVWPYTAWMVEERKVVRMMGYAKTMNGSISLFGQWRQRKTFCDTYEKAHLVMPWDAGLLEGTSAENSKLDLYIKAGGKRLVSYLALWRKRPAVENLLVQDCGKLVDEWINNEKEHYPYGGGIPKLKEVNWKEKRPAQMLGLNKEEFQYLRQMKWNADDLEKYKMVREAGIPIKLPVGMNLLRSVQTYNCNWILEEAPKVDFWRVLRYLARQGEDWSTLRDYWRMAREDGRDLEDSLVRWPRDLKASHNRQIEERRAAEARKEAAKRAEQIAARAPLFLARAEALDKLSFARDGLLIRPCANEEELIIEGKLLHHCVAGYAKNHANGKTAILFVRRADKPEKPFFTLEFDEKNLTVRQNRGLRNCDRTPEVEAFEKAWLEWVKAGAKKKVGVRAA